MLANRGRTVRVFPESEQKPAFSSHRETLEGTRRSYSQRVSRSRLLAATGVSTLYSGVSVLPRRALWQVTIHVNFTYSSAELVGFASAALWQVRAHVDFLTGCLLCVVVSPSFCAASRGRFVLTATL